MSSNPQTAEQGAARAVLLDALPGSLVACLGAIGQSHPRQEVQDLVVAVRTLRN